MKRLAAVAVGWALCAGPAHAEPFTVDRLLALEQLGPISVDPSQRWLVVQVFGRWDSAPRFDLDDLSRYGVGKVRVFDLKASGQERALGLPTGAGYVAGPVSPDGGRLTLCRLVGRVWELGVVDLRRGGVTWLGVTPRFPTWGRTLAWRDDARLVVAAADPAAPEVAFGIGWRGQARVSEGWARTAQGAPGLTVLGSGRYRGLTPRGPEGALIEFDLASGQRRSLAQGDFVDFEVSPTQDKIAALAEGEDIQPSDDTAATSGTFSRRRRLMLVDLKTGSSQEPCPTCDVMSRFLAWAPSGKAFLVFARKGSGAWRAGGYWRVSAASGAATPLALGPREPALVKTGDNGEMARGAWLDGYPAVPLREVAADGRTDWFQVKGDGQRNLTRALPAPARLVAVDDHGWIMATAEQAWRVSAKGATPLAIAPGDIAALAAPEDGERLAINTSPSTAGLAVIHARPNGQNLRLWDGAPLPALMGQARLAAVATSTRQVIDIIRNDKGIETVGLRSPGQARRSLLAMNAALNGVDFVQPVAVRHFGIDGEALTSWLYLPPKARNGARAPVVIIPYPGEPLTRPPASQDAPAARLVTNAQILVARGYAVLIPSLPYRAGKEPMAGLAAQMLVALDAAAKAEPVDPYRAAIWGHSYGAYAAVAAATQNDRFKAIIASAATTNLVSAYGRLGPMVNANPEVGLPVVASAGWLETGQARMGVPPWTDPARYLRNSPVMFADRIRAPILMFYGDNDKDLSQPQGLFAALYRQDRDAIFVTYRGEGHVVSSPGNVRDQYARIFAFLDERLGPARPPVSPRP